MNRHDPLSAEERELARLLGRGSERAPSAALDDAILAAAREAATIGAPRKKDPATASAPARRRSQRLQTMLGVAASVVFAVGIAWQLRPDPPPRVLANADALLGAPAAAGRDADGSTSAAEIAALSSDEAAEATSALQSASQDAAAPEAAAPMPSPAAAPADVPVAAPAAPAAARLQRPSAAAATPSAPGGSAEAAGQDHSRGRISAPASAPAAFPPAPAAATGVGAMPARPAAAIAPAPAPSAQTAQTARRMSAPVPAAASTAIAPPAMSATPAQEALQHVVVTGSNAAPKQRPTAAPIDAATARAEIDADAGLSRRQWLQKIRERRDAGCISLARASLERYLRTYPETRLPSDLRPLLDD